MSRWSRSLSLAKSSWSVIRSVPHLIVLPAISFLAAALVAVTFAVPAFLTTSRTGDQVQPSIVTYVILFCMYVALAYVTIFFNTALICAAQEHFDGGTPTIGSALSAASQRAVKILPWAIVSATVSVVLRAIQERAGIVGRLVVGLIGIAWTLVTFLVLPIIALEGLGVGAALKRSATLFKQTWGEQVITNLGIGLVTMVAFLCGLPLLLPALSGNGVMIGVGVGLYVIWVLLVSIVSSAMSVVFQTALYRYASSGDVPAAFADNDFAAAFVPKPHRSLRGGTA